MPGPVVKRVSGSSESADHRIGLLREAEVENLDAPVAA